MTIEEDFETVRKGLDEGENLFEAERGIDEEKNAELRKWWKECVAALDRIEAERRWLWDGLEIHGEDFARCRQERDALKLELDAEKFNHRKDNEYLVQERDALKAELNRVSRGQYAETAEERDALKAALDALVYFVREHAPEIEAGWPELTSLCDFAAEALTKLEEK